MVYTNYCRSMNDLFGQPIVEASLPGRRTKTKPRQAKGYAAPPGTGPAGEACKTCQHWAAKDPAK